MKLRRFVAADMRSALALIKEELGPEAVIMSNKRVEEGVEIIAGISSDESGSSKKPAETQKPKLKGTVTTTGAGNSALKRYLEDGVGDDEVRLSSAGQRTEEKASIEQSTGESFAKSLLEILERQKNEGKLPQSSSAKKEELSKNDAAPKKAAIIKNQGTEMAKPKRSAPPEPISSRSEIKELLSDIENERKKKASAESKHGMGSYEKVKTDRSDADDRSMARMRDELQSLRKLLQFELAGLIRDKGVREQPVRAMIAEILSSSGFDPTLAQRLSSRISADASVNFAWRELRDILVNELKTGNDEIIREGGVITLIGPAGVGKTTTAAKLAARFVIKYGPKAVALVSADHYRIGAAEQMKTYGRIMGCDAYAVKSMAQLRELLPSLAKKSLVIVDTAGVGSADDRFEKHLSELKSQSALHMNHYLVLPAGAQRRVLEEAGAHFASLSPRGLILTKTDESPSLCDALSMCIKNGLTLCYTTCGQRVPEDLKTADAKAFVNAALSGLENETAHWALGEE